MNASDNPSGIPIPVSYWVEPGRLIAGEYPGAPDAGEAASKIDTILASGVTSFVDLTEDDGWLEPYEALLDDRAHYRRTPIRDNECPTAEEMHATLDLIDHELAKGEIVYVHCWGGHGRTGAVVGCWLVRHGRSGEEALQRISELRRAIPPGEGPSPRTPAQCQMVRDWREE